MTSLTMRGVRAARREAARRRALEELLRPRARRRGCTRRPIEPTLDWIEQRFAKQAAGRATPTSPRSRPATTSARRPSCSTTPTRSSPAQLAAGHLHATSPATPRSRGASSPPASWPSCRCSSARTRSRRRPTSSTSCRSTRTSASARSRPRTRSPPSAWRSARRSPATSASPPRAARASP